MLRTHAVKFLTSSTETGSTTRLLAHAQTTIRGKNTEIHDCQFPTNKRHRISNSTYNSLISIVDAGSSEGRSPLQLATHTTYTPNNDDEASTPCRDHDGESLQAFSVKLVVWKGASFKTGQSPAESQHRGRTEMPITTKIFSKYSY